MIRIKPRTKIRDVYRCPDAAFLMSDSIVRDAASALPLGPYRPSARYRVTPECCIQFDEAVSLWLRSTK